MTKEEIKALDKAEKDWRQASQDHIDYIKYVRREYKGVSFWSLPHKVIAKIMYLQNREEHSYKLLVYIQDKYRTTSKIEALLQ